MPSSIVAQLWYFLHNSSSEFQNLIFSILHDSLLHKASIRMFEHENPISHEPPMNILIVSCACKCLPQLWHNIGIFFISRHLSFKILIFKFHMIACSISFDSHVWTQKSDIRGATYEHCNSLMRAWKCLPQLWHKFGIFFITRPLSFKILIFKFHMIACSISFDSHVWT